MKLTKFHTAIAIGSLLAASTAFAQAQKGEAETKSPSAQSAPKSASPQQGRSSQSGQSGQPAQQGRSAERGNSGQGASKSESKRQMGSETGQAKRSAQGQNEGRTNRAEKRDGNGGDRAQARSKANEKSKQAESSRNRDQNRTNEQRNKAASKDGSRDRVNDRKTTANGKSQPSRDNKTAADRGQQNQKGQAGQNGDRNRTAGNQNGNRQGGTERVQLSEQQRTQAKQTFLRSRNVNRARQASFTINVGSRVPRSVRLAAIPAAVITLVPQYRNYRYVVVDDRICIVDPNSYDIVEVLDEGSGVRSGGTQEARLVLTPEEEDIVLQSVEMGGSTLGLGAITIGSPVPRNARMMEFPAPVLDRVSKLRSYEFVAADNRVAIVEPRSRDVVYIIERRR